MDKSVNYILSKLKVLSKLQSGQKLMIEDQKISIMECDKSNWDRFIKWWLGETRHSTLDKLQGFYLEIRDIINTLSAHPEDHATTLRRLSHELSSSMRGLNNLMLSYQDDRTIVSQLETLYENFNIEVTRVKKIVVKLEPQIVKQKKKSTLPPPPPDNSEDNPIKIKLSLSKSDESDSFETEDSSKSSL